MCSLFITIQLLLPVPGHAHYLYLHMYIPQLIPINSEINYSTDNYCSTGHDLFISSTYLLSEKVVQTTDTVLTEIFLHHSWGHLIVWVLFPAIHRQQIHKWWYWS